MSPVTKFQVEPHSPSKRWAGSVAAVGGTYLALTAAILWTLNEHPIKVVTPPVAAPIVLEIAPLPVTSQTQHDIVQEEINNTPTPTPVEIKQPEIPPVVSVESKTARAEIFKDKKLKEQPVTKTETKQKVTPPEETVTVTGQKKTTEPQKVEQQQKQNAIQATQQADQSAAAVSGGSNSQNVNDNVRWESLVLAQLQKLKRYPSYAQRMGQEDVIIVQVNIDAKGKLINYNIQHSKGYEVLDREVKSLVQRASPFPAPPQSMLKNNRVELVVPIEFFMKKA